LPGAQAKALKDFMLEQLPRETDVPPAKTPIDPEDIGNTVIASILILICRCQERRLLYAGQRCVQAGFAVGYSWAIAYLTWASSPV
jgi:3-oxoacyl-[acyl-carrier-protein] synthase III